MKVAPRCTHAASIPSMSHAFVGLVSLPCRLHHCRGDSYITCLTITMQFCGFVGFVCWIHLICTLYYLGLWALIHSCRWLC